MSTIQWSGYSISSDGTIIGRRGKALRPETVKGGYKRVAMVGRRVLLHVLIAELFIGPKPDGTEVNHKNGDKANNAASNLEYLTPGENVRHSLDVLGVKRARGERNSNATLTEDQVRQMRALYADGVSALEIDRRFALNRGHAWRVVTGQTWRHVA